MNKRQDADSRAEMEKKDDMFKPAFRAVMIFWKRLMTGRSICGIDLFVLTFPGQVCFSCGLSCIRCNNIRCNIITHKSSAGKERHYVRGRKLTPPTFGLASLEICHLPGLFWKSLKI